MRRCAGLLLLAILAPPAAGAPDRYGDFRELAAALPAPGPGGAFVLSGEVVAGGETLGTFMLSAAAVTQGTTTAWQVRTETSMGVGAAASRNGEEVWLTPGFTVLRGRGETAGPRGRRAWTFDRVAGGFRFEPGGRTVEHEGPAVPGLAGLVLLGRLRSREGGDFRAPWFDAGSEGEEKIGEARIDFAGKESFRGREAIIVRATQGGREIQVAFEPATRAVLGASIRHPAEKIELLLLPPGSGRPPLPADFFDRPALTPEAGAARAALAILSGDTRLAEAGFHWPTLYTEYRRSDPTTDRGYEEYKRAVLAKLAAAPGLLPRGEAEAVLRAVFSGLAPEAAGEGRSRVRFPRPLSEMVIEVALIAGEWRLVALPPAR
ncbi:MAG: hypothetical protein MUE73_14100 [Planctomycetes bacterium]|nr:hypothetical protein [Planctomycetota bacterium]